jgi:hypothetical protein
MDSLLADKQCSISNYIKQVDKELDNLLNKVFCAGRLFRPRSGTPGITFLRPTGSVLKKLRDMALGDGAMGADEALRSMVLHDYLPNAQAFAERKEAIPTSLRRKLPVKEIKGEKIILENGAVLEPDKKFVPREDRQNMAVWLLTKDLVPTDGEELTVGTAAKKIKQKQVKGGAEFQDNKRELFEAILREECKRWPKEGSAAMEALCTICDFLKARDQGKYLSVCSLLSWDCLGSLAIVLQPYSAKNDYLTASEIGELSRVASCVHSGLESVYAYVVNPKKKYEEHMKAASDAILGGECAAVVKKFVEKRGEIFEVNLKMMTIRNIEAALAPLKESQELKDLLPARGAKLANDFPGIFAEAEARINYYSLLCDSKKGIDCEQALKVFKKHNLDRPYFATERMMSHWESIYYRGSVEVILRSDALFYFPGQASPDDVPVSQMFNGDEADIRMDADLEGEEIPLLQKFYDEKEARMSEPMRAAITNIYALITGSQ